MSPPRKTLLRPIGLMTQPAKFGWYKDGALQRAINCVMRNPGELDAAPSMFGAVNCGSADNTIHKVMPLDAGHYYTFAASAIDVWDIRESNNFVPLPSSLFISTGSMFSATGRISPVRAKDRMLVNSKYGFLVGDVMAPTSSTERALRIAGLPQLALSTFSTMAGGALPPNIVVNYAAVHTRVASDGYTLVSAPSVMVRMFSPSGGDADIQMTAFWGNASTGFTGTDIARVGDVIEIYRSDGLATSDPNSTASTTLKLVASRTLASADIANGYVTIIDSSKMGDAPYYQTTGRELYCNPGQGGATTINRQPPVAACTAAFDGRVFYGNTTDRPKVTFQIPAGIGSSANAAQQTDYWRTKGIGARQVSGLTITNGSAVITGGTATSLQGIKAGQVFLSGPAGAQWPLGATVVSVNVGAGTITMSTPASAAGSGTLIFADVIYIGFNGGTKYPYRFGNLNELLRSLAGEGWEQSVGAFELTSNVPLDGAAYAGQYTIGAEISIEPRNFGFGYQTMQVTATNGANYSPALPEYNTPAASFARTTLKNRLAWSKDQQPEHVPVSNNEAYAGLREIIAMVSTRDALWIACLDGIFRLTGIDGQYRLDQIDSTKIICAPQAMCVLDEDVFVYTNFGVFMMNSEKRTNLTDEVIGDLLPGPEYKEIPTIQLCANETDLEIIMLDVASKNRLYVYATRDSGGWTTLENNGSSLSNITALAYQRSPSSGDPMMLIGVSPMGGSLPTLAGWGNTSSFLAMDVLFQPIYQNDPISLKHWIEASYIFDAGNAGKTLRPVWNGTPVGSASIALYQNAAYARAGVPRDAAISQSIMVGFDSVTTTAPQARFLGLSVLYYPLTTQAKQRG
jgi:hypothetical protein